MAFMGLRLFRTVKNANIILRNVVSSSVTECNNRKISEPKEVKNESNFVYLEDPDHFGTLSRRPKSANDAFEDEGDIKEQKFLEYLPLPTQQLTIKQYSDIIKHSLKHKKLKEAIDVLEVRMIKEDRVKPNNYIYNILIGACADVGYTKKAFKLYNDMKRRALSVTGDTYTCLFEACSNSPWPLDGLKNATHLKNFMTEKGIEPNLTNYNAMIKAFGRCGDLPSAFKIVDEMISKKIKVRVHTLNHLLHACISDKQSGLRHALVVWRKMLKMREKPNIYTFNLMLKCVKDCNLGSKEDIEELIAIIQEETPLAIKSTQQLEIFQYEPSKNYLYPESQLRASDNESEDIKLTMNKEKSLTPQIAEATNITEFTNEPITTGREDVILEFINKVPVVKTNQRTVPNLLSKTIILQNVLSLQKVQTLQEKFAVIGGQEDFLKEMEVYSVKPDVKTFTQMLLLLDDNMEAENKLIETMKAMNIKADIDFYNMLIKKRCMRSDYESAIKVKNMIEMENKHNRKKNFLKKKLILKPNVMTYGVLAMACRTKESAEQLLSEMKEKQLRVNIATLGALLRQGTSQNHFDYVIYIMNVVKEENVKVNDIFLKHLETFNDKCLSLLQQVDENSEKKPIKRLEKGYKWFSYEYKKWLRSVNIGEVIQPDHPWQQFRQDYPETVQRQNIETVEPKRFYKRNRKFVKYIPRM